MTRRIALIVLVSGSIAVAVAWGWCRTWEGAIGGWSVQVGDVALGYEGYGYDLVIRVGKHPGSRWRPSHFGMLGDFGYSMGPSYARFWGPFWFAFMFLSAYPTVTLIRRWFRRARVRNRRLKGECTECGYDLTGNVSGACPECAADARS